MASRAEDEVDCPICNRSFPVSGIEGHANKCIFLNVEDKNSRTAKRGLCHISKSPVASKKTKLLEAHADTEENTGGKSADPDRTVVAVEGTSQQNASGGELNLSIPLAEQMRPVNFAEYIGQTKILGQGSVLRKLIQSEDIPSMILWGPPGCGKTTLAHIIAKQCRLRGSFRFLSLSATMAGVNDVKDMVKTAKSEQSMFKRCTILFMDEIHRFNKLQQDIFLPHVESGLLILIGATTENPSFSLNSALLSRCRVIVLEKLSAVDLQTILSRAAKKMDAYVVDDEKKESPGDAMLSIDKSTLVWLSETCDGDARIALNSLQMAVQASASSEPVHLTLDSIKEGIKKSHLLYDRKGEEHYNIISALHKSIRASQDSAALYWLTRMLEGGEDPLFIARRLVRAASEDIGLAEPMALTVAVSAMQACQLLGMPECDCILAQCAVYLARCQKSREMDNALARAKKYIQEHAGPLPSVPLHLRNAPTRLMKNLGYGKGYNMDPNQVPNMNYMPQGMANVNFFED